MGLTTLLVELILLLDLKLILSEDGRLCAASLLAKPNGSMPSSCAFFTISPRKVSLDVSVTLETEGDVGLVFGDVISLVIGMQLASTSPAVHVMFVGVPMTDAVLEMRSTIRWEF